MKNILILFLGLNFLCTWAFAYEFDTSIDDEIRRNYNPSKLEEDVGLPALPKIIEDKSYTNTKVKQSANIKQNAPVPKVNKEQTQISRTQINSSILSGVILKRGTKIPVKILTNVSDRSKKGTRVKFISLYPVSTTYFTIPMGTEFYGQVVNSHRPQFAANGGLIEININSIIINNEIQPVNAYVTKANDKMIFFNNIKGKRKYLSSMAKSTKNGRHFFGKMMRVTVNLASDGSSIVVAPFSLLVGTIALGGNIAASPILAFFHKGDSISINSGSLFELKLSQDMFISN